MPAVEHYIKGGKPPPTTPIKGLTSSREGRNRISKYRQNLRHDFLLTNVSTCHLSLLNHLQVQRVYNFSWGPQYIKQHENRKTGKVFELILI